MSTIYQISHKTGTIQILQSSSGQLSALQNGKHLLMRGMPNVTMNQAVEILDNSFFQLIGGELQIHARLSGGVKKTQSNKDISEDFLCPITQQIMFDPVVAADGETYEREAIEKHLNRKQTSPLHGDQLEHTHLNINRKAKRQIDAFLEKNPDYREDLYLPQSSIKSVIQALHTQDTKTLQTLLRKDKRLLGKHYSSLEVSESSEKTTLLELACTISPEILSLVVQAHQQKPNLTLELISKTTQHLQVKGVKVLMQTFKQNPETNLPLAIDANNPLFLQALLELGANPNVGDPTPLHQAAQKSDLHPTIIDLLIEYGADAKAVNDQRQRPSTLAKQLGHLATAERIEQKRQEKKLKHLIEPLIKELAEQKQQLTQVRRLLGVTHQALIGLEQSRTGRSAMRAIQELRFEIGEELGIGQVREIASLLPAQALGAAAWAHLGDVGEEPPLPENMEAILAEPCPTALGLKRFGTTIGETHILVLIPATLNGEKLTLERFKTLLDSRDGPKITRWLPGGNGNNHAAVSYWALISKDCIQGSKSKTYAQQKQMVAQLGDRYRLPKFIEMVFGLYLQEVTHHDNLYANSWGRCEEMHSDRYPMACRGFGGGGGVSYQDDVARIKMGVGVFRLAQPSVRPIF